MEREDRFAQRPDWGMVECPSPCSMHIACGLQRTACGG